MSVAYDLAICPDVSPFEAPSIRPSAVRGRLAPVSYLVPPRDRVPWRLTARGVRVVALAVLALSVGLVALAWHDAPAAAPDRVVPAGTVVTVGPDDSLWSIATRVAPDRDPRAEVEALQAANSLPGVVVHAGERLIVP
jgi:hypothetical protein